jgi:hypothetical protein
MLIDEYVAMHRTDLMHCSILCAPMGPCALFETLTHPKSRPFQSTFLPTYLPGGELPAERMYQFWRLTTLPYRAQLRSVIPCHISQLSFLTLTNLATSTLPTPQRRLDQASRLCFTPMHDGQEFRVVEYVHVTFHACGSSTCNQHDVGGNTGDVRIGLIPNVGNEDLIEVDMRQWLILIGCDRGSGA